VERAELLSSTIAREIDRDAGEVIATDFVPTTSAAQYLERRVAKILAPRRVGWRLRPLWLLGCRDVVYRRAYGVVGVIGTWNYPLFINAVPILQALVAGNAVVWKPSERMPETAAVLTAIFHDAGFPKDILITLPATREGGAELAEADVDYVHFTGSDTVGRKLAARLGERLIPSTLELSGADALFVCKDANLSMAARTAWYGATLNRGRTCMATRRVLVDRVVYSQFQQELEKVKATAKTTTRVIDPATPDMPECVEPSFESILAIMPYDTIDEALQLFSRCEYSLTVSFFTADHNLVDKLAPRLKAGSVLVNDVIVPAAHPATPFGGRGASGWGTSQGDEGLLGMTVPQHVSHRYGTFRAHLDATLDHNPYATDIIEGSLRFSHAPRLRDRWRGFWRLLRGLRKLGKS
jgi:acyl-CoA reductase-like NAD-dependent aldehyde dehydrogenase